MRNRLALVVTLCAACSAPSKAPAGEADAGIERDASPDDLDAGDPDAPGVLGDAGSDHTAPALVEITPASGSTAWLHAPIRLTFDEDLAAGSVAATTVTATLDGTTINALVALEHPRTVAITLDPSARGVGTLALRVPPMLADNAGNVLSTAIDVALQLQPWSTVAIDRGVATGTPSYVVDARGTVTAAWLVGPVGLRRAVIAQLVGSAWHNVGAELGVADVTSVSLALDESGVPLVAVADQGVAHVARWNGATWSELASPGNGSRVAIATPPGGRPIVAVFAAASVSVRELVNNSWQPLGSDIAAPAPILGEPALATPAPSRAVIGWIDATAQLRVYRLDAGWTAFSTLRAGSSSRMSLAARGSSVAVAYDTWGGSFAVLAAIATGGATTFTQLGRPLDVDISGDARNPAIALDASGVPIVAWTELVEAAQRGVVARWSGSAWTIVGGRSFLASLAAVPLSNRIVLDEGGAPIVATIAGGAFALARFNGPRDASLGLAARASLAGCSFNAAAPPPLLSQTGCFDLSSASGPVAHAGLVPYDIVAELWSDGARKRRWIALPAGQMTLGSNGAWAAPIGTFLVKEFALETTPGNPATRRPIETRILSHDATNGWEGFSYRWNLQGTDATLLADDAFNIAWQMDDGSQHVHVYPSRQHCRSCHYYATGPLLGLRPEQLARWYDYNGVIADQLATLAALGIGPSSTPPTFTAPHDPSATWERRTRGYMAANCAHCHNPDYISIKDLRYATPLASTRLCEVILPGSPQSSIVYQRVTSRPGMPALGTAAVDPMIQELLGNWISGMTSCP